MNLLPSFLPKLKIEETILNLFYHFFQKPFDAPFFTISFSF